MPRITFWRFAVAMLALLLLVVSGFQIYRHEWFGLVISIVFLAGLPTLLKAGERRG